MNTIKILALLVGGLVGIATASKTTEEVEEAGIKFSNWIASRKNDEIESTAEEVEE